MKKRLAEMKAARLNAGKMKSKYLLAVKREILGSAGKVECLWSMADHILTNDWASMSPLVFECIMYLKYNRDLWDLADVVEANKRRKNESKVARKKRERLAALRTEIDVWEAILE